MPPPISHWFAKQTDLSHKRILLSAGAALTGIALMGLASQFTLSGGDLPFMVASMGAAAVLLFVVPSSRLSTPWAFAGGHVVSALIGVSFAKWVPNVALATAGAVAGAILAMHYLRCLHPPGGAAALMAVLGGNSIQSLGYQYVLTPVLLNVVILLGVALVYWRLAGINQHYDNEPGNNSLDHNWQRSDEEWLAAAAPFDPDDLVQAVAEMDTFIDINQHDLHEIYSRALQRAHTHDFGDVLCKEVMSSPVKAVQFGTELEEAWALFERYNIRGLPVVDSFQRVIGIVTVSDFVHMASDDSLPLPHTDNMAERLALLRQPTPGFESDKPEVVGQIMTSPAISARADERIADKIPLFNEHHIHHMPVVDEKRKLVGMLTREDIMAARTSLCRP
ncbi:MAG TPA: CBS domain-containing protein [Gammaproteobacteria bacterium]|nr:CBS domain-containing protein [Gammaproteobacteria bacterium]